VSNYTEWDFAERQIQALNAECRYAECRYAECRYAERCYAECISTSDQVTSTQAFYSTAQV
jgi:hypothetical protein